MPQQEDTAQGTPPDETNLTQAEFKSLINRVVDKVFDPQNDILRKLIIQGLSNVRILPLVAPYLGFPSEIPEEGRLFFLDYLGRNDKEGLRSILLMKAERHPETMTRKEAEHLLGQLDIARFRKILLSIAGLFKGTQGRPAMLKVADYPRLITRADSLVALIGKILTESETAKSPLELLLFWQEDHREAASFLIGYYQQFETALADEGLKSRAKGLETRARIIADAMAGVEYGYSPRTSVERVGQARRALKH